tara:strand:+ start:128 stop:421 length:294 start_codon:yes stop_codon:yes gene_type:complete
MIMRIIIIKFPSETKKDLALSWMKNLDDRLNKDSKIIQYDAIDIGEGKILTVAKYNSNEDFLETNKWLKPLVVRMTKDLTGIVEDLSGDILHSFIRN